MTIARLKSPTEKAMTDGRGSHGADATPTDDATRSTRDKARAVSTGADTYSYDEMQKLLAKIILDA